VWNSDNSLIFVHTYFKQLNETKKGIQPSNMRRQVASNQDILTGTNNDIIHTIIITIIIYITACIQIETYHFMYMNLDIPEVPG